MTKLPTPRLKSKISTMDYVKWNQAVGNHFFGEHVKGKSVFMCVTRDTLAEIADMSPEQALGDFVNAIFEGPDWTRIRGCRLLETKVQCCLHIDPQYGMHSLNSWDNPASHPEKTNLKGHIYWADSSVTTPAKGLYPPYLCYLAAFVLAWTERNPDSNGNDYYNPLLDLLDPQRTRWPDLPAFGRRYTLGEREYSLNDVWKDLMRYCEAYDRGELVLPDAFLQPGGYVDAPKYFGLMKASDLRNLGKLFTALEDNNIIDPGSIPRAEVFVTRVLSYQRSGDYLSPTSLHALGVANDAMLIAFGRLLQGKYRDFDGVVEEDSGALHSGGARAARVLRAFCRDGSMKFVCCLRSENAWEKLPLGDDCEYEFQKSGGVIVAKTRWVPNTPWFNLMDLNLQNLSDPLELSCKHLRLKAKLTARQFIVMRDPGLHFLAGCRIEVDEIEKGRQYILLVNGDEQPRLGEIQLKKMNVACPSQMSCWSFTVPEDLPASAWPVELPALLEEKVAIPKLKVTGFRLRPRELVFPVGLPIWIRCNRDEMEVLVTPCSADEDSVSLSEEEGVWKLMVQGAGSVTLSLQGRDQEEKPGGGDLLLSFVPLQDEIPEAYSDNLIDNEECPLYPDVFVALEGGFRDLRDGLESPFFFASGPPRLKLESQNLDLVELQIMVNGQAAKVGVSGIVDLPSGGTVSAVCVEVRAGGMLIKSLQIGFSVDPKINVKCVSTDRSMPTLINDSLKATITELDGRGGRLPVEFELLKDGNKVPDACGVVLTPTEEVLLYASKLGLTLGDIYEIRFRASPKSVVSQWFRFRESGGSDGESFTPKSLRPPGNSFNSLGNAFDRLSLTDGSEGGEK
jgi:hypothetical protein